MKENKRKSTISIVQNGSSQLRDEYTILVPIRDPKEFDLVLPTAIDLAAKYHGKVILLNIIEIPYQLPPSAAKIFVLERELLLSQGLKMLERAECRGCTAVRIAHNANKAIERFSKEQNANIIIREHDPEARADTIFKRLKNRIKSWF